MALDINPAPEARLAPETLAAWRDIPASIIGDELNRSGVMNAGIKPLAPGTRFAGQALTAQCMVGDNIALHYALALLWPGAVLVVDARGHVDTAVWGEIMHTCAKARGAAAVVIDGAMRDGAGIAASGLAAYARATVPLGPHKGWGGAVNGPVQCGGVPVAPGDLLVGDDDGVAVVGPARLAGLLERCRARMAREDEFMARAAAGESTVDILGLPPADEVGR